MFRDRLEAGRLLADLFRQDPAGACIIGLEAGGAVVGVALAEALGEPLEVLAVEPLATAHDPDVPFGWVTARGFRYLDPVQLRRLALPPGYLAEETARGIRVAAHREERMRGPGELQLASRRVILVADGIAASGQVLALVADLRARAVPPFHLTVASPVVWPGPRAVLPEHVDELALLHMPAAIALVGQDYLDFPRVGDLEVRALLEASRAASF